MTPARRARLRRAAAGVAAAGSMLVVAAPALAQSAANVAVVINEKSPASVAIGEHYVQQRGIPPENVVKVAIEPTDTISRRRFEVTLEIPIAQALTRSNLQDRIHYIVLTKGVPLRIIGTTGLNGTAASVDSELTLLYRRMTGKRVAVSGPVENPYFAANAEPDSINRPFSHKDHDIFLVTRLDAFTVKDAIALIDRGLATATSGSILLDQRTDARSRIADDWMREAADGLRTHAVGRLVTLEDSAKPVLADGPALGYFSWGTNDPAIRGRELAVRFVAGSIAATFGSSDASTFEPKTQTARPSVGDLVKAGASGVGGNVAEPFLQSSFRPQILFHAYLKGSTIAEAFYRSLPHLSWQSIVVGDPLVRPFGKALPQEQFDPALDAGSGMPSYFSARRLESLRAEFAGTPDAALFQLMASESHVVRDDRPRAIEALDKAAALAPDNAEIHLRLALLRQQAGDKVRALEGYRRALASDPDNVIALNNLAFALAASEETIDEAAALARKAHSLSPQSGTVLDTLGWIEHLQGNGAEAVKLLREAVKRAPAHPEIRLHAAIVLAGIGAVSEARNNLDAALKLDKTLETRAEVRELVERLR